MALTTDPDDPRLGYRVDREKVPQNEAYLVLPEEELAKEYVRPVRREYTHTVCGTVTRMNETIAETYARDPKFYGATYCIECQRHLPLSEFRWGDGTVVGS